jgi:hypothetical protein
MTVKQSSGTTRRGPLRAVPIAAAPMLVLASLVLAPSALARPSASTTTTAPAAKPSAAATLEQCVTASEQTERSATFAGEMNAVPGSAKMEMRIDVLERMPKELVFHIVTAPGLGVWRVAAPGVKSYKYLKEITNLAAPASYRAVVRFRWLNSRGRLIKSIELRTPRCLQPVSPTPHKPPEETTRPAA